MKAPDTDWRSPTKGRGLTEEEFLQCNGGKPRHFPPYQGVPSPGGQTPIGFGGVVIPDEELYEAYMELGSSIVRDHYGFHLPHRTRNVWDDPYEF